MIADMCLEKLQRTLAEVSYLQVSEYAYDRRSSESFANTSKATIHRRLACKISLQLTDSV